jgi:hypothetical protein
MHVDNKGRQIYLKNEDLKNRENLLHIFKHMNDVVHEKYIWLHSKYWEKFFKNCTSLHLPIPLSSGGL